MCQNYVYKTSKNDEISITTFGNQHLKSGKCLIYCHGFKGFKDWGFVPYVGKYFAERGYFVITFNFSHNGIGNNPLEFTEPDKFAENTFSLEVNELNEIINAVSNGYFGKIINPKIGIIGHSRGGAVALLAAYNNNNVNALITWSSIAKLDRYSERQKKEWLSKGYFEVLNSRTNQIMRMNKDLLKDIINNKNGFLNIEKAAKDLNKPWLIIHGEQDLTVKSDEAEKLYGWSNKHLTELQLIPFAGHTFNIVHPMEKVSEPLNKVLKKTEKFIEKIK
ncbi:alpha/beta hydrolase family protein [bacterium BMS3Abin04]|nr:alpha/beta hydrolase family protein [bacterium BMS3Abin04]